MKVLRWITAVLVSGFLLGALASAVSGLLANGGLEMLANLQNAVGPLSEKILGPMGTVLLAAIYLCRDFLPDRKLVAISAPQPSQPPTPSHKEPPQKPAVAPKFELRSFPQEPEPRPGPSGLDEAVRSIIATEPGGSEYSAQRFFVTDSTGNRRGVIGVGDDGALMLALFASDGDAGFVISEDQGAPTMAFYDVDGQLRARLSLAGDSPRLTLSDADGKQRAGLSIRRDGSPYFFIADKDQSIRLAFAEQSATRSGRSAADQQEEQRKLPL